MKTHKTTSTVTVVLANGETVVYDNAGLYQLADGICRVYDAESSKDMARMAPGEYRVATRTIECREVKKRVVYVVRYLSGLEFEYSDLFTAYNSVLPVSARGKLDSIRREEREELA